MLGFIFIQPNLRICHYYPQITIPAITCQGIIPIFRFECFVHDHVYVYVHAQGILSILIKKTERTCPVKSTLCILFNWGRFLQSAIQNFFRFIRVKFKLPHPDKPVEAKWKSRFAGKANRILDSFFCRKMQKIISKNLNTDF